MDLTKRLKEKWNEAVKAVLPIIGIVLVLCFTVAPMSPSILLSFLVVAILRMLFSIPLPRLLIAFYFMTFILAFFVPKIYTAIAFDSGGVASGPMTAAFLLPLAQGACVILGGNIVTDAFGVVAMVAMTPLITIQVMGLYARIVEKRRTRDAAVVQEVLPSVSAFDMLDDNAIIEL